MDKKQNHFLINKYFWLNSLYKKVIHLFQKEKLYHSFIIYSYKGNGVNLFTYALILWIMCVRPKNIQNCGICSSCQLMLSNNHPNFFYLNTRKKEKKISLDEIRSFINTIHFSSYQDKYKIIWFSNIENLKEIEISIIIKLLNNPPKKTYFLFTCNHPFYLTHLFQGKSIFFCLKVPEENDGIDWLYKNTHEKKVKYNLLSIITALRLNHGAPLAAKKFLYSFHWQKRSLLCKCLYISIKKKNMLLLFSMLNCTENDELVYWILTFILDAIHWSLGKKYHLINEDKKYIIFHIYKCIELFELFNIWKNWITFLKNKKSIKLNSEIVLINQLIFWNKKMRKNFEN